MMALLAAQRSDPFESSEVQCGIGMHSFLRNLFSVQFEKTMWEIIGEKKAAEPVYFEKWKLPQQGKNVIFLKKEMLQ